MLTHTALSQYYFWEAVDLARRIALTGALLMIKDERILRRLYVALLTSLVWLTFLMATVPFKRLQFDLLSVASSFTPCATLAFCFHRLAASRAASRRRISADRISSRRRCFKVSCILLLGSLNKT